MTTQTIRNGTSIDVPIPTGQTLKVVAVTGTYTITVTRGTGIGTALATAATGASYGPYAYDRVVRLVSSDASEIDFDVAVTPVVDSDTEPKFAFDSTGAVTGLVGPGKKFIQIKPTVGPVVAWLGDSIFAATDTNVGLSTPRQLNYSIQSWTKILSGQRFTSRFTDNYATSGYQTADLINNGNLAAVVAAAPSVCVVLIGTNDIASSVPIATTKANLATIYSTLLAAGVVVIACPILPRSSWTAMTLPVAQQQQIANINNYIKNYGLTTRGMYVADTWPGMVDTSNGLSIGGGYAGSAPPTATSVTYDGLHPAPRGAYWVGKAISDVITQVIPPQNTLRWSPNDTYDATNNPTGDLMTNGFLTTASGGTAGTGVTGTVAGSWTCSRIAGTTGAATASVVTKSLPNGSTYNAQRLVITAPSGSTSESFQIMQQRFVAGLIGKSVIGEAEISLSGLGAASGIRAVYLETSDGVTTCADQYPSIAYMMPDVAWSGVIKTQPFVMGANVQQLTVRIVIDGTVAGAGLTIDASRMSFRATS